MAATEPKKVVLAIDSLKGCLSSAEAEAAAAQGIAEALPGAIVLTMPASDGGEGMVGAFVAATKGRLLTARATMR